MFAGHDADVFAVPAGRDGVRPGNAFTVTQQRHAVDGFNEGDAIAQQDVADGFLLIDRQIEASGDVNLP